MPKATVTTQHVATIKVDTRLEQRCESLQALSAQIKELEERKKTLSERILADAPDGYESDDWKITAVKGTSASRISKEILIKLGVSAKIIQKAELPGSTYTYPKVTKKEAKSQTGDD